MLRDDNLNDLLLHVFKRSYKSFLWTLVFVIYKNGYDHWHGLRLLLAKGWITCHTHNLPKSISHLSEAKDQKSAVFWSSCLSTRYEFTFPFLSATTTVYKSESTAMKKILGKPTYILICLVSILVRPKLHCTNGLLIYTILKQAPCTMLSASPNIPLSFHTRLWWAR